MKHLTNLEVGAFIFLSATAIIVSFLSLSGHAELTGLPDVLIYVSYAISGINVVQAVCLAIFAIVSISRRIGADADADADADAGWGWDWGTIALALYVCGFMALGFYSMISDFTDIGSSSSSSYSERDYRVRKSHR